MGPKRIAVLCTPLLQSGLSTMGGVWRNGLGEARGPMASAVARAYKGVMVGGQG